MENKIIDFIENLNDKNRDAFLNLLRKEKSPKSIFDNSNNKITEYIDDIMQIPFGRYKKPLKFSNERKKFLFLHNIKEDLDDNFYGHDNVKTEILSLILKSLNTNNSFSTLGLLGKAGSGKTELVKNHLSKIFNRPVFHISLGGCKDGSFFDGHDRCYVNSRWGIIVDAIIKTNCFNPIIFFDELDKVSETKDGNEIINKLIHMIDPVQNKTFHDKYFKEFEFDLSKITFIFSLNNKENINSILLDRIKIINLKDYTMEDKINITKKILIPRIQKEHKEYRFNFSDECIKHIILRYTEQNDISSGIREIIFLIDTFFQKYIYTSFLNNVNPLDNITSDVFDLIMKTDKEGSPNDIPMFMYI